MHISHFYLMYTVGLHAIRIGRLAKVTHSTTTYLARKFRKKSRAFQAVWEPRIPNECRDILRNYVCSG